VGKLVGLCALVLCSLVLGVVVLVAVVTGGGVAPASGAVHPSSGATGPALPPGWVVVEQSAAATCPGLSWSVLAAIGTVESDSGRSTSPGVTSGSNPAGAEGPMQFEPATFAAYATVGPGGAVPASPYDTVDAVYTAAALLCASGAGSTSGLRDAVFAYNHSVTYVDQVLTLSLAFAEDPGTDEAVVGVLEFAAGKLGTPYLWGGTGSGGFDCSGLTRAAFGAVGVPLPRVAQDQFDAGPAVGDPGPVRPGDLLYFGTGPTEVDHVGIYVGSGLMIDAPHTGADVRLEGAGWPGLVGATRPG
jgi:cell wall-associated NlpC family hydrolase